MERDEEYDDDVVEENMTTGEEHDFFSGSDEDFINATNGLDSRTEQDATAEAPESSQEEFEELTEQDTEEVEEAPEEEAEEPEEVEESAEAEEGDGEHYEEPKTNTSEIPEAYRKIFEPFKANGKTLQVDNADDAMALMQMGANYHKKMQDLKPHLKTVKMLKSHDLLDEQKLALIIDASKGNTAAFRQLAKEANVNLEDLAPSYDGEEQADYQPKSYQISDEEFELDSTLDDLRSSDSYGKLLTTINKDFDAKSKTIFQQNPQIIRTINDHINSGLYNDISDRVSQLKMLGKVSPDIPDVEVYGRLFKQYTEAMQNPNVVQQPPKKVSVSNQESKREKRRAVAPPKKAKVAGTTPMTEEDILNMPDSAFEQMTASSPFRSI